MRTLRLVLKVHRLDILALGTALLLVGGLTFLVGTRLVAIPDELNACTDPPTCVALQDEQGRLAGIAAGLLLLSILLPVFAGLLFGIPIVAREVERGTAFLPWTLSRTRWGWLLPRVAILAVILAVLTAVPALALERLTQAIYPGVDLARSFDNADGRGAIVVARALVTFAVAVCSGALLGRVLPGILLAVALAAGVVFGAGIVDRLWLDAEAAPIADPVGGPTGAHITGIVYQLPDGRLVDWQAAYEALGATDQYPEEHYPEIWLGIPGDQAPQKGARASGVLLLLGLGFIGAATVVVERRRPY